MKRNIFILISIFILIISYFVFKKDYFFSQDDLFFFSSYNYSKNQNKKTEKYKFEISKGIQRYQIKSFWSTIDKKTLVNEKVAPGTKGNFEILLTSNYALKYYIYFKDINKKPKNLKMYIKEGEKGDIYKNQIKVLHVFWEWKYEINSIENIQDTEDGENLKKYYFEICIIGE